MSKVTDTLFWVILILSFSIFMVVIYNAHRAGVFKDQRTTQNLQLAEKNHQHIDCIARLFAKYTRDAKPVTIQSLDICKAKFGVGSKSTSLILPESGSNNNQNSSQKTTHTHDTKTQPAPEARKAKVLGVPICLPFSDVCVTHK